MHNHSLFILLATLLSSSLLCTTSHASKDPLVDQVCSTTMKRNRGYCTRELSSKACACRSNIKRMGTYITHVAMGDVKSFDKAHVCADHFASTIDHLKQVSNYFKKNKYNRRIVNHIKTKGSTAMTYLNTCSDDLRRKGDPDKQVRIVDLAKKPIAVLLAIANKLPITN